MLTTGNEMEQRQGQAMETMVASAIHRLCQPLTAMQCMLELGQDQSEPESLRAYMHDASRECVRVTTMLSTFRELVETASRYRMVGTVDALELARLHGLSMIAGKSYAGENPSVLGIKANHVGMDMVLRHMQQLLAAMHAEALTVLRVEAASVHFCWNFLLDDDSLWKQELKQARLFSFSDSGLTPQDRMDLMKAALVAEAMGGRFDGNEHGIEITLPRIAAL